MANEDPPDGLSQLAFHGPMSEARAAQLTEHRSWWLRGYRNVLGLAYLTLVPVG